jgi:hypothetical protein
MPNPLLVTALARSFLGGELSVEQIVARGSRTLGKLWPWLRPLAQHYVETFADQTRPRHREVVQFLLREPGFERACAEHSDKLSVEQWLAEPWDVPAIASVGALADWLRIKYPESVADLLGGVCTNAAPRDVCITARRASCVKACGNTWQASSRTST